MAANIDDLVAKLQQQEAAVGAARKALIAELERRGMVLTKQTELEQQIADTTGLTIR